MAALLARPGSSAAAIDTKMLHRPFSGEDIRDQNVGRIKAKDRRKQRDKARYGL
ncbi:MAG: hypothetical protein K2Q17_01105 [Nitrospiraceae bacterium]|nr:hypothetical protein [Nitrospiraceae bacterium]